MIAVDWLVTFPLPPIERPWVEPMIVAADMFVSVPPRARTTPGPLAAWIWPKLVTVLLDPIALTPALVGDWMEPWFSTLLLLTIRIAPTTLPASWAPASTLTV